MSQTEGFGTKTVRISIRRATRGMKLEKKIEPAEEDVESLISVVEVDGHRVLRVNSSDQEPQNRNEKLGRIIKQALLEVFDHSD